MVRKAIYQFAVELACEVTVEPFVATDEFVAEVEVSFEYALFEPAYGTERS